MGDENYRTVSVKRNGKTYSRKQPLHHRISRGVLKKELKRLGEQKEVIEENISKAKQRVKKAIQ